MGCVTSPYPHGQVPEGFALVSQETETTGVWTTISPEGVKYRLRLAENKPFKTLDFWSRSLTSEMDRRGFIIRDVPFYLEEKSIWGSEWIVPQGTQDYLFLTALKVAGDYILIAEAAGPVELFIGYRETLFEALVSIHIIE